MNFNHPLTDKTKADMNTNAQEGAFPVAASYTDENPEVLVRQGGLTKREYFAGLAMQGILANSFVASDETFQKMNIEKNAIKMADALLAELEKQ